MESQPQNPEFRINRINPKFRINPENFHPCSVYLCHLLITFAVLAQITPNKMSGLLWIQTLSNSWMNLKKKLINQQITKKHAKITQGSKS